jgi:hypothetical protein
VAEYFFELSRKDQPEAFEQARRGVGFCKTLQCDQTLEARSRSGSICFAFSTQAAIGALRA